MANTNYVLIDKITVGAATAASVTFSGIPQTGYTDLVIKSSARSAGLGIVLTYNGTTIYSNTSTRGLYGNGSAAAAYGGAGASLAGLSNLTTYTSNTFGNSEVYIPNYTGSTAKSSSADGVAENNATGANSGYQFFNANLWSLTSAITSITLTPESGTFSQYSTFYLYGVAKLGTTPAIFPKATGGDTIMTDGTYWYHAFVSSGTFTPASSLSCDVLVVAGGGGGGYGIGGGGGAGGVLAYATQSFAANTGYTATIGAGGAGNTGYPSVSGSDGTNTSFGGLTAATGGGGGMGYFGGGGTGRAGGSGGGGGGGGTGTGGTGTSGQGNNGGTGTGSATWSGGGGGGAGAVGSNASASVGGNGGAGTNSVTNWGALSSALTATGTGVSGYLAGGGGGATFSTSATPGNGGSGGGGLGGKAADGDPNIASARGTDGTANTGSGGGGGGGSKNGGAGGSGLVVIRYAV
jgi:hypothetical protein